MTVRFVIADHVRLAGQPSDTVAARSSSRSWSSALAATAAFRRGPSSRFIGPIFATDQPSSGTHTQQALSWEPKHPSLLQDLENIQP